MTRTFTSGRQFMGPIATIGSTDQGWLLGTTAGVWEIRLNDRDLRHLPEMKDEGVFRFEETIAFTNAQLFRLDQPWERYPFSAFEFLDVNDVYVRTDTVSLATKKGLRRFLWERRAWDDAPLGSGVEDAHLHRFLLPAALNDIDVPDSVLIRPRSLLVGSPDLYHQEPVSRQWQAIEGARFSKPRHADTDSVYRHVDDFVFQDLKKAGDGDGIWRRWIVLPTGVSRVEIPGGAVPFQIGRFPLSGDVRGTYVDDIFVWIATTSDLYVIDREFDSVDRFFEAEVFVWGLLGRPQETTYNVQAEERGWYLLTSEGMTEVFTKSWSWDAYGFDRFSVGDVLCEEEDVDGFWIGTTSGLRWFDTSRREWVPSRVPVELRSTAVRSLEWQGKDLYALTDAGLFSSTRHALVWRRLDGP